MDVVCYSSPAESVTSDMTDEELDAYFANYVPLSNLPTPPPPVHGKEELRYDMLTEDEASCLLPEFKGPSAYLANLVPSNASTRRPCVSTIHAYLVRASLPVETAAYACCILDALSTRFVSNWRSVCLSAEADALSHAQLIYRHAVSARSPEPELIVLAALALATDFLDDRSRRNSWWARHVAGDRYVADAVHQTKICMLKDLDYRLHRFTHEMVLEAICAMGKAGTVHAPNHSSAKDHESRRPRLSLSMHGTAVWCNGMQTPEPSP